MNLIPRVNHVDWAEGPLWLTVSGDRRSSSSSSRWVLSGSAQCSRRRGCCFLITRYGHRAVSPGIPEAVGLQDLSIPPSTYSQIYTQCLIRGSVFLRLLGGSSMQITSILESSTTSSSFHPCVGANAAQIPAFLKCYILPNPTPDFWVHPN